MTAAYVDPWQAQEPPDDYELAALPEPRPPVLPIRPFGELAADVDARGPRQWLIRGVWPAGDYGVHSAEPKAGKTWNALDLAVSVASGTPWLGAFEIDTPGGVTVFAGEGGDGNIVRRLRGIAAARGLVADTLPLWVCTRAPHLADGDHMRALDQHVEQTLPALVVLDPLYLAAGGANGADLYGMGALLEKPQHVCQRHGASLLVVHHNNRSRDATGAARASGAGPAEWARVLITSKVLSRHTGDGAATTVLTELDVIGGEVPDQTIRVRRTVHAVDPDNLDSSIEYTVDTPDADDPDQGGAGGDMPPAAAKLLAAVRAATAPATSADLVDWVFANHGHGLKRETCSRVLNDLETRGLVDSIDQGPGRPKLWTNPTPGGTP